MKLIVGWAIKDRRGRYARYSADHIGWQTKQCICFKQRPPPEFYEVARQFKHRLVRVVFTIDLPKASVGQLRRALRMLARRGL